jgi:hypothetical protein
MTQPTPPNGPNYTETLREVRRTFTVALCVLFAIVLLSIGGQFFHGHSDDQRFHDQHRALVKQCQSRNAANTATGRLLTGLRTQENKVAVIQLYNEALKAYDAAQQNCSELP